MADSTGTILLAQLELQRNSFGIDPRSLRGEERADYARWNVLALNVELAEALQEMSWKPWASADYFNREAFFAELIDALHFWMNLALLATENPDDILGAYMIKHDVNARRQADGYTGLEKCPGCGRER